MQDITKLSTTIREELKTLCQQSLTLSKTTDFPPSDSGLEVALNILDTETYDVVVCGEVKKGKSSLINAIIGKDILPVDTKVATSQAFRVINDDKEQYFIVYTDGTKSQATKEDLENFGSQARIDQNGEPIVFDRIVDYMEIHTPITFLPKSIILVDTPGLGALYANHAVVTKRHLAKASAVIFVLDPFNPITQPELEYLDNISKITPNILFVMTKQDNYDSEYISTQIKRDIEILHEKGFDERFFGKIKILPMSSKLLKDCADTDNYDEEERDIFYAISSFEKVKTELQKTLEATIALSKNVFAYNAVNDYNNVVMTDINERNKILTSPDESKALLTKKQEVKANFQGKWGQNGKEQQNIIKVVNDIVNSFSVKAMALFNPGTEIYNKLLSEIETIKDYNEAKSYAECFPNKLTTEYMQAWQGLNEECFSNIIRSMEKTRMKMVVDRNNDYALTTTTEGALPQFSIKKRNFMDYFNDTKAGWFTLFFAVNIIGLQLSIFALPIAALIGLFTGNKSRTDRIKGELRNYLNTGLASLRNQILTKPTDANNALSKSLFEKAKDNHLAQAQEMLKKIYDEQLAISQEEINRINSQIERLQTEKESLIKQQKNIKETWNPVYLRLKETTKQMAQLEELLNTIESE